jgi:hypothetical protein
MTKELIEETLKQENEFGIHSDGLYKDFMNQCDYEINKLKEFTKTINQNNKQIWIYGASTKGNVLLQTSGLNYSHIRAIGEVNTRKLGKQTPGSCIPIVSEKELIESAGNKTLALVLPWHFRETLIISLETFLSKGGKLLFPLPNIEEVST